MLVYTINDVLGLAMMGIILFVVLLIVVLTLIERLIKKIKTFFKAVINKFKSREGA